MLQDLSYDDISPGASETFEVEVSHKMVHMFAELTGDQSPLHVDEAYAQTTEFGGRVVHGMLLGSFFSRIVGMHLPGKRALYLSQDLRFHNPLLVGETVVISGVITKKYDALKIIELSTTIKDRQGKMIVSGIAKVKVRET